MLAGGGDRWLIHTASIEPICCQFKTFAQFYLGLKAQLAPGFARAMLVVAAEHHRAKLGYNWFGACDASDNFLRDNGPIVDRQMGQVQGWALTMNIVRDSVKDLLLGHGPVVGNVVDIAGSVLVVARQHKTLHNIGYVTEGQAIVALTNDKPLAVLYFLGHTSIVQAIARSKERGRSQDDRLYIACEHQAAH